VDGKEGLDYVRCRICGDHRRVISRRHLSKHGTDREEYMEEFGLSPDQLIASDFRRIQSSRPGYTPLVKHGWVAAIRKAFARDGNVHAGRLQRRHLNLYHQGTWLFGTWDNALRAAGFTADKMRLHRNWNSVKVSRDIRRLRAEKQPLNASYVNKNNPALFGAALRHYGRWDSALRAAGISTSILKNGTARRKLARAFQAKPLHAIPGALKLQAEHYFGTLRNARKEAEE
jgi:hypothetical protein